MNEDETVYAVIDGVVIDGKVIGKGRNGWRTIKASDGSIHKDQFLFWHGQKHLACLLAVRRALSYRTRNLNYIERARQIQHLMNLHDTLDPFCTNKPEST